MSDCANATPDAIAAGRGPITDCIYIAGVEKTYEVPDGSRKTAFKSGTEPLRIAANSFVMILGKSGSGKSTLLNLIGGNITPELSEDSDDHKLTLNVDGVSFDMMSAVDRGKAKTRIGTVFQEGFLISFLRNRENISMPLRLNGIDQSEGDLEALSKFVCVDRENLDKLPGNVSGGQAQRFGLARALAHDPDLILADEPTSSVDSPTSVEIVEALREWRTRKQARGRSATIVWVTHNVELAARFAERILIVEDGLIVHQVDDARTEGDPITLRTRLEEALANPAPVQLFAPSLPERAQDAKASPEHLARLTRDFVRGSVFQPLRPVPSWLGPRLGFAWSSVGATILLTALTLFLSGATILMGLTFKRYFDTKIQDPVLTYIEPTGVGLGGEISQDMNADFVDKLRFTLIELGPNGPELALPDPHDDDFQKRIANGTLAFKDVRGARREFVNFVAKRHEDPAAQRRVVDSRIYVEARDLDDPLINALRLDWLDPVLATAVERAGGSAVTTLRGLLESLSVVDRRCASTLPGIFVSKETFSDPKKLGRFFETVPLSLELKAPRLSGGGQVDLNLWPAYQAECGISGLRQPQVAAQSKNGKVTHVHMPIFGVFEGPGKAQAIMPPKAFESWYDATTRELPDYAFVWIYPQNLVRDGDVIFRGLREPPFSFAGGTDIEKRFDSLKPMSVLTQWFTLSIVALVILMGFSSIYVAYRAALQAQRSSLGVMLCFGATRRMLRVLFTQQVNLVFLIALICGGGLLVALTLGLIAAAPALMEVFGLSRVVLPQTLSGYATVLPLPELAAMLVTVYVLLRIIVARIVADLADEEPFALLKS